MLNTKDYISTNDVKKSLRISPESIQSNMAQKKGKKQ